jgi:hypothetical protein
MAQTVDERAERDRDHRHLAAEIAAMLPHDPDEARHILDLVAEMLNLTEVTRAG